MQKVVINVCFGGFGLSTEGIMRYAEIKGITLYPEDGEYARVLGPTFYTVPKDQRPKEINWQSATMEERIAYNEAAKGQTLYCREIERNDPALVQMVEELGGKASGKCANLRVVEIPDGVAWEIDEYDGNESVHEVHHSWR